MNDSQARQHRTLKGNHGKASDDTTRGSEASPAYRDFSQISANTILKIVEPPPAKRKGPRGGVTTPFPVGLFDMLREVQKEGLEHIVSWQPHGRSFIVRKAALFESSILPRFFSQSKMSSFQRQLNLYGFLRQNCGPDRGSYYHELFLQGRPDLPKIMVRTRVKGVGMGRTNKMDKEPDFYSMSASVTKLTSSNGESKAKTPVVSAAPSPLYSKPTIVPVKPGSTPTLAIQLPMRSLSPHDVSSWMEPHHLVAASSYSSVVTPSTDEVVFPTFALSERATNLEESEIPMPRNAYGFAPQVQYSSNWSTGPGHFPYFPTSQDIGNHNHCHSKMTHLQPRYNISDDEREDTGIFEGLEFQVIDDDSLEQFEYELITDAASATQSVC